MREPAPVKCDICQKRIDTTKPWHRLHIAVDPKDGREILESIHAGLIERLQKGPQLLQIAGFPINVPSHVQADLCISCGLERIPNINEIAALLISIDLEQHRRQSSPEAVGARNGD